MQTTTERRTMLTEEDYSDNSGRIKAILGHAESKGDMSPVLGTMFLLGLTDEEFTLYTLGDTKGVERMKEFFIQNPDKFMPDNI